MNKSDFLKLEASQQASFVHRALNEESDLHTIFGDEPKTTYLNLSKVVHPDRGGTDAAFQCLNAKWELAQDQINLGIYGDHANSVDVEGTLFPLLRKMAEGEIANVYLSEAENGLPCVIKIVRDFGDIYMMQREVEALNFLAAQPLDDFNTLPIIITSSKIATVWNYDLEVVSEPEQLVSLYDLAASFDNLLPDKAVGWIWRRVLGSLLKPGHYGVVHGAMTPDNILIDYQQHRSVLVGWGHSTLNQAIIEDIPADWEDMYPTSVLAKEKPTPRVDVHVAAESMLWAAKSMPAPMKVYFEGMTGKYGETPYSIPRLLEMWDMVLYQHLGWKKEFVPLAYNPKVVDWTWFHV